MRLTRRQSLAGGLALLASSPALAGDGTRHHAEQAFAALERRSRGRLGVCVLDTGSGGAFGYRMHERFALCSTFKLPLAGLVLLEADRGRLDLDEVVPLVEADRVPHAPVTGPHIGKGGLQLIDLIKAAQTTSDNVAANVVLRRLGGPPRFTELLRALGDRETRVDRLEPVLNVVGRGEHRDTTTPLAIARTFARFTTGTVLSAPVRQMLVRWMVETDTGRRRLRAGLPPDWLAGDKTGTALAPAMKDKINDVAVAWPPGRAPCVIACYLETGQASESISSEDEKIHSEVAQIVAQML